jgi:hypothetical protein
VTGTRENKQTNKQFFLSGRNVFFPRIGAYF